MRIFLCIAGNTCSIWELALRSQAPAPPSSPPTMPALPAPRPLSDELANSSVYGFVPLLGGLVPSKNEATSSLSSFFASLPGTLACNRQHRIFAQLLMLYRITRQHWISINELAVAAEEKEPANTEGKDVEMISASGAEHVAAPSAVAQASAPTWTDFLAAQQREQEQRGSNVVTNVPHSSADSSMMPDAAPSLASSPSLTRDGVVGVLASPASPTTAAGVFDGLDDILLLWRTVMGSSEDALDDEEALSSSSACADGGVARRMLDAQHLAKLDRLSATSAAQAVQGLSLSLLSRNIFNVLVQLLPVLLRVSRRVDDAASPTAKAVSSTLASSLGPSAEQHATNLLRTLYLASIAQSVAYVTSLGVCEGDTPGEEPSKPAATESGQPAAVAAATSGAKRKAGASAEEAAVPAAPDASKRLKALPLERGVTLPLDELLASTSNAAAAAHSPLPPGLSREEDSATEAEMASWSTHQLADPSKRARLWQHTSEKLALKLSAASSLEVLLSTACIADVDSLQSLALFCRACRLRLIDLSLPFHLHVTQQRQRQAQLREDGRAGSAPWTSLCAPLEEHAHPLAHAVQQLVIPFVRQSALFLSAVFAAPVSGKPSGAVLDFQSIFPPLCDATAEHPSGTTFTLGSGCQRMVYMWYQNLFLPVWAKRALIAGANRGRVLTPLRLPPLSPQLRSVAAAQNLAALSPPPAAGSTGRAWALSPPPNLFTGTAVDPRLASGADIISPPRLSSAVPRASVVPTSATGAPSASAPAAAAASSASPSGTPNGPQWALSSFTPYSTTFEGGNAPHPPNQPDVTTTRDATAPASGNPGSSQMQSLSVPLVMTPTSAPTPMQSLPGGGAVVPSSRLHSSYVAPLPCVSGDVGEPFSLCGLPAQFHTFLTTQQLRQCVQCRVRKWSCHTKAGLESLCVCLLCGGFVCLLSAVGGSAKCYLHHAQKCDGRIGLFLVLRRGGEVMCVLQPQHSQSYPMVAFWPSLYLDQYGEGDWAMSRGRPLMLHQGRVRALTREYVSLALHNWVHLHAAGMAAPPPMAFGNGNGGGLAAIAAAFQMPPGGGGAGGVAFGGLGLGGGGGNPFGARPLPGMAAAMANAAMAAGPAITGQTHVTVLPGNVLQTLQGGRQQQQQHPPWQRVTHQFPAVQDLDVIMFQSPPPPPAPQPPAARPVWQLLEPLRPLPPLPFPGGTVGANAGAAPLHQAATRLGPLQPDPFQVPAPPAPLAAPETPLEPLERLLARIRAMTGHLTDLQNGPLRGLSPPPPLLDTPPPPPDARDPMDQV